MRALLTALTLLATAAAALASAGADAVADAVAAAAADVARLPPGTRPYTRYLSLEAVPLLERPEAVKVLAFHVNSLSREADFGLLRLVTAELLALDVRDYGWDPRVYEKLGDDDPYFHALVRVELHEGDSEFWPGGKDPADGEVYARGRYTVTRPKKGLKVAAAPWLPAADVASLVRQTRSATPVLRADWFFYQTATQAGRNGHGYYDFLGLKKRQDFERLTGLDVHEAKRLQREVAAIIRQSGISQNNRQVFRYGAVDSGYWRTLDVLDVSTGARNALANLNGDFLHDTEEHYGVLPNRLYGYYLSQADGTQQESAPDKVGPDSTSATNDGRVHPGLSCVVCHKEGLRPLDDYGRKVLRGPLGLQEPNYYKFRRLRRLYLGPLDRHLARDRAEFADALARLNGSRWTVRENALAYRRAWKSWWADDVTRGQAAGELGVSEAVFVQSLKDYFRASGKINLVLAGFVAEPPEPMRRDHWEEQFGFAQTALRGFVPAEDAKEHP